MWVMRVPRVHLLRRANHITLGETLVHGRCMSGRFAHALFQSLHHPPAPIFNPLYTPVSLVSDFSLIPSTSANVTSRRTSRSYRFWATIQVRRSWLIERYPQRRDGYSSYPSAPMLLILSSGGDLPPYTLREYSSSLSFTYHTSTGPGGQVGSGKGGLSTKNCPDTILSRRMRRYERASTEEARRKMTRRRCCSLHDRRQATRR